MLYSDIEKAQKGEQTATMHLIDRFAGLFRKYGKKLGYDDAENDLMVDFIEMIYRIKSEELYNTSDGAMVNFLCQATYRMYLKRLKNEIERKLPTVSLEDITPVQMGSIRAKEGQERISQYFPVSELSQKETMILIAIYEYGYSAAEIAAKLGVSRQNINQIKKRAVEKLRKEHGM